MKTAILGGGFGLYGYLPALIECGADVVLPLRHKERVLERPELAPLASKVEWRGDDTLLAGCEAAVIAPGADAATDRRSRLPRRAYGDVSVSGKTVGRRSARGRCLAALAARIGAQISHRL